MAFEPFSEMVVRATKIEASIEAAPSEFQHRGFIEGEVVISVVE